MNLGEAASDVCSARALGEQNGLRLIILGAFPQLLHVLQLHEQCPRELVLPGVQSRDRAVLAPREQQHVLFEGVPQLQDAGLNHGAALAVRHEDAVTPESALEGCEVNAVLAVLVDFEQLLILADDSALVLIQLGLGFESERVDGDSNVLDKLVSSASKRDPLLAVDRPCVPALD